MGGLDRLLAASLDSVIRTNLGEKSVEKIEKRMLEKYGITLRQSMEQFHKIDSVLREFFGAGTDQLEKKFLEVICRKNKVKNLNWIDLEDSGIKNLILDAIGDEDKKKILDSLVNESHIISDVLSICKIPQTSGYRKINNLIDSGLLIKDGFVEGKDGKKVAKYKTLFENIRINLVKGKLKIEVQMENQDITKSSILQVIYGL